MKNEIDYSQYKCPYSHLEKECGHELRGPEGYEDTYGVWCACGFRGPVFYVDPDGLKLERIQTMTIDNDLIAHQNELLCRLRIEYQSITDHMAGTHGLDDLRFKEHVTSSLYQIGQLLETIIDNQC